MGNIDELLAGGDGEKAALGDGTLQDGAQDSHVEVAGNIVVVTRITVNLEIKNSDTVSTVVLLDGVEPVLEVEHVRVLVLQLLLQGGVLSLGSGKEAFHLVQLLLLVVELVDHRLELGGDSTDLLLKGAGLLSAFSHWGEAKVSSRICEQEKRVEGGREEGVTVVAECKQLCTKLYVYSTVTWKVQMRRQVSHRVRECLHANTHTCV